MGVHRQLNELMKTMHEQNENKELEINEKTEDQIEGLELKNTMNEMKNAIESFNNRFNWSKWIICELKDKSLNIMHSVGKKK